MRRAWILGGALVGAGALAAGAWLLWGAGAGAPAIQVRGLRDYVCETPGKVYFGRLPLIRRPAAVTSSAVYAQIPEYREILSTGVDPDHPRYSFLMVAATSRFTAAVSAMAREHGHDVVAEAGAIRPTGPQIPPVPDRTAEVSAALDLR